MTVWAVLSFIRRAWVGLTFPVPNLALSETYRSWSEFQLPTLRTHVVANLDQSQSLRRIDRDEVRLHLKQRASAVKVFHFGRFANFHWILGGFFQYERS